MTQPVEPSRRKARGESPLDCTTGFHRPVEGRSKAPNGAQPPWRYPEAHIIGQDGVDLTGKIAEGLCQPAEGIHPYGNLASRFQHRYQASETVPGVGRMMEH